MAHPPSTIVAFDVDLAITAACEKQHIPPPNLSDRNLIAIHAACARVAYASGDVEQADCILVDKEDSLVLAQDARTADLLSSLLLWSSIHINSYKARQTHIALSSRSGSSPTPNQSNALNKKVPQSQQHETPLKVDYGAGRHTTFIPLQVWLFINFQINVCI